MLFYANFVAGIICCLITLALCCYIYVFLDGSNTISSSCGVRWCSFIALIAYCITSFSISYRVSLVESWEYPSTRSQWEAAYLSLGSWRVAQAMTYIVFIKRLKTTFHSTPYASSKCTYFILYILSILFMLLEFIKDGLFAVFPDQFTNDLKPLTVSIEFTISAILDLVLSVMMLYLFLIKTWRLNKNAGLVNRQYMRMNHIMAKITNLWIWSLVSTQILIALFAITFFMHHNVIHSQQYSHELFNVVSVVWIVFWGIDCCINCFCIFWSFDCTLRWYIVCCLSCHDCCVQCYADSSKTRQSETDTQYRALNDPDGDPETRTRRLVAPQRSVSRSVNLRLPTNKTITSTPRNSGEFSRSTVRSSTVEMSP